MGTFLEILISFIKADYCDFIRQQTEYYHVIETNVFNLSSQSQSFVGAMTLARRWIFLTDLGRASRALETELLPP